MKKFLTAYWIPIIIIGLFIVVEVWQMIVLSVPSWDAAVYIGMGKYLFSHGAIGTWESLRPVGLPIIVGAFWKLGINPYVVGSIFGLIVSVGMLILAYIISEQIKQGTGAIATTLLAGCGIFLMYSAVPLTDIPSAFFALWALYLVYVGTNWKQYFFGGLLIAVAFMFRFPQGLMLVVSAILIVMQVFQSKGKLDKKLEVMIERGLLVLAGFFVIVLPYLFANIYFYHNAFLPFIEGTNSIKGYASLYQLGFWYYFKQIVVQDPLFILSMMPIALLWKKAYRNKTTIALSIALIVFSAYFIYQPHKEIRYALAFLPYVAILSAVAIGYILEWTKMPQLLFFGLFVIVGFMLSANAIFGGGIDPNAVTFQAFDSYLANQPGTRILSSTPYTFADSDVLLTHNLYGDWDDAYYAYNTYRSTNDYIALDSCNLEIGCADDAACKDDKPLLLAALAKNDTQVFSAVTPKSQCTLLIYKLNK